jgi:hypothetical protein
MTRDYKPQIRKKKQDRKMSQKNRPFIKYSMVSLMGKSWSLGGPPNCSNQGAVYDIDQSPRRIQFNQTSIKLDPVIVEI